MLTSVNCECATELALVVTANLEPKSISYVDTIQSNYSL